MDHQRRCIHIFTDTLCHGFLKSCQAAIFKAFSALSARKWHCSIAVDPFLIIFISGKLFVIFILKLSKITFRKFFYNVELLSRKKNFCRFHTAEKWTYKQLLRHGIGKFFQKFPAFIAQRLIRCTDITRKLVSRSLTMTYQI